MIQHFMQLFLQYIALILDQSMLRIHERKKVFGSIWEKNTNCDFSQSHKMPLTDQITEIALYGPSNISTMRIHIISKFLGNLDIF